MVVKFINTLAYPLFLVCCCGWLLPFCEDHVIVWADGSVGEDTPLSGSHDID